MTLAEIVVVCEDDRAGGEVWNDADLAAYRDWWLSLTPEQRLWAAQVGE